MRARVVDMFNSFAKERFLRGLKRLKVAGIGRVLVSLHKEHKMPEL